MESKAHRLVMILEAVAIVTAAILILVDYKLKNDLVELYKRMEATLEDGRKLFGKDYLADLDTSGLHAGPLVGDAPTVETSASPVTDNQNGTAVKRPVAKRSRRVGNTEVSQPDKPVGS